MDDFVYPEGFVAPGPATQVDELLTLMEDWLTENSLRYVNMDEAQLSPEQWVKFRAHYAIIHWMWFEGNASTLIMGREEGRRKR